MVEVNKSGLVSEIDSIIAGLNLSTAETEVLSSIYKAAVDAGANANTILSELTSRIEAASSDSEITDVLTFSVITDIISANREMSVANLTALNALTNISIGSVYYVDSLEVPYIKTSVGWSPIELNSQLGDPLIIGQIAYAWGSNLNGKLGDNTTIVRRSPVSVVGGYTDWADIGGGRYHSVGLRTNGTTWTWGKNNYGQLGDNTTIDKSSPVSVVGGFTDWVQISSGLGHGLAIRSNGTAWAWGNNGYGRLGDNTGVTKSSPVLVAGGFTDWIQVSAGSSHSLGVRANGTAWAWGQGGLGMLGTGNTATRSSPVSVVGGFTDWTQVSAGQFGGVGLRSNGTIWTWGYNSVGQLGNNSTIARSSPVSVVGGFTDWTQVSAGRYHILGVRANGTAWGWGTGSNGVLGDNSTIAKSSPVSVVGGYTDWVQVSANKFHSLGLRSNGTLWAWGYNGQSALGDNTVAAKSSPVSVVGGFTDWIRIQPGGAGNDHSLAIRTSIS